jgi:hypothetical protein
MSSQPDFQPSTITLVLKGLMVLFTNKPNEIKIGLLRQVPVWHNKKIEVLTRGASGEFEPVLTLEDGNADGMFDLAVTDTSIGISKHQPNEQIDRFVGPQSASLKDESFNWLIDFEREFYPPPPPPIGANKNEFCSFITLNSGEIFTIKVSDNHLQYRRINSPFWIHFGKVAVILGIRITLNTPESRAVLTKAGRPIFDFEAGTEYHVSIERTETSHDVGIGHDADYYFTAIGTLLEPTQHLLFRSFPPLVITSSDPPNTPDAACPQGLLSQSDPT